MRRFIVLAFAALTLGNGAAPVCGRWVPQTNGTSWRICTDVQNQRYCEIKAGGQIKRMVCP
jgi:hypothetical protein